MMSSNPRTLPTIVAIGRVGFAAGDRWGAVLGIGVASVPLGSPGLPRPHLRRILRAYAPHIEERDWCKIFVDIELAAGVPREGERIVGV